ncbi:hypothetical protein O5162_24905 [Escherichia coli]|nr:hypothetical protein [Escherichia coli]
MNKIILFLIFSTFSVGTALANSLQSQIAAIAQAENEGRAKEQQAEDARKELIRQQAQAERIRREKQHLPLLHAKNSVLLQKMNVERNEKPS